MKTFDEAGRELAEKHRTKIFGVGHPHEELACQTDFLAGRDSCKEALETTSIALASIAKACEDPLARGTAAATLKYLKAAGCWVGEK